MDVRNASKPARNVNPGAAQYDSLSKILNGKNRHIPPPSADGKLKPCKRGNAKIKTILPVVISTGTSALQPDIKDRGLYS